MKIGQTDAFIKAREYLDACDALDFRYKINTFGQICFQEGEDWASFDALRSRLERPSLKILKAVLLSLGRLDKPYEAPEGPMQVIDVRSGLVIGEIQGAVA
jgi:hypothetical protein